MAFSYTGSALNTLVDGLANNAAPVVTLFNDVKAVLNNGITGADHLSASANIAGTQLSATAGITGSQLAAGAAIAGTQLSSSAAIADTQLASPNNPAYKTITAANFSGQSSLSTSVFFMFGTAVSASGGGTTGGLVFYLDPADFVVAGKTAKYRVRAQVACNQVAPAITITCGLYPVTFAAGAATASNAYSNGTVTSGSTVAFATPSSSTQNQSNSGDFTAPAAGYYALGYVGSAAQAVNSVVDIHMALQQRNT